MKLLKKFGFIIGLINWLIKKVNRFINRLMAPDADLWPKIILLFSGLTTIWCGGYALSIFSFITPLTSAVFLIAEAIMIIAWLGLILIKTPANDNSPFDIIMEFAYFIIIFIVTALICTAHLWWPRVAAGIGAGINFTVIALTAVSWAQELLKEKRKLPTRQLA